MILLAVFTVYCRVFPHRDAASEDTLSDALGEGSHDGGGATSVDLFDVYANRNRSWEGGRMGLMF